MSVQMSSFHLGPRSRQSILGGQTKKEDNTDSGICLAPGLAMVPVYRAHTIHQSSREQGLEGLTGNDANMTEASCGSRH
jgi:hypothetical protein